MERMFNFLNRKQQETTQPIRIGSDMYLGDKKVRPRKVTPEVWKQLFEMLDSLPAWIIQLLTQDAENFPVFLAALIRESTDEVVRLVSVLSGIDEEYLEKNAAMSEIIAYLKSTAEINDFTGAIKNVWSLLPRQLLEMFNPTTEMEAD